MANGRHQTLSAQRHALAHSPHAASLVLYLALSLSLSHVVFVFNRCTLHSSSSQSSSCQLALRCFGQASVALCTWHLRIQGHYVAFYTEPCNLNCYGALTNICKLFQRVEEYCLLVIQH